MDYPDSTCYSLTSTGITTFLCQFVNKYYIHTHKWCIIFIYKATGGTHALSDLYGTDFKPLNMIFRPSNKRQKYKKLT